MTGSACAVHGHDLRDVRGDLGGHGAGLASGRRSAGWRCGYTFRPRSHGPRTYALDCTLGPVSTYVVDRRKILHINFYYLFIELLSLSLSLSLNIVIALRQNSIVIIP